MPLDSYDDDARADIIDETRLVAVLDELISVMDQIIQDIEQINRDLEALQNGGT